jgi:hypothetical protein
VRKYFGQNFTGKATECVFHLRFSHLCRYFLSQEVAIEDRRGEDEPIKDLARVPWNRGWLAQFAYGCQMYSYGRSEASHHCLFSLHLIPAQSILSQALLEARNLFSSGGCLALEEGASRMFTSVLIGVREV